jgi:TRAP transporter TAXI family solute receptor
LRYVFFLLLMITFGRGIAEMPTTMVWSAYNLGSTGYSQSVAIGKMLKDHYGVTLRVLPGRNDVSRLLPLVRGRVHLSANGIATYFAQEGMFQFEGPTWGPIPVRLAMSSNGDSNQALAVATDTGIKRFEQLRGKRIPYVRGAPSINVSTEAFLACGGLGWQDVERVDFTGYNAMWNGIVNGQVDAAYATTVSGPTRKLEASPRGISWPTVAHDDDACWQRLLAVGPYFTKHVATRGAGISAQRTHEGATYPYPLLIGLDSTDEALVYSTVQAIDTHYDDFKDADPGAVGWAMSRQLFAWVVPYHRGAVRYFVERGLWSDELEAHNRALIERQAVLAEAWGKFVAQTSASGDEFRSAWRRHRVVALEARGFDPVWR